MLPPYLVATNAFYYATGIELMLTYHQSLYHENINT